MDTSSFKHLTVSGEVSIHLTSILPRSSYVYLILGPTGAGKSSFIESLAGKPKELSISSDQLGGYTQHVVVYRVGNVLRREHYKSAEVYMIDTPGFSDTTISEIEIMDMIRELLDGRRVDRILFLTPITQIRLGGTKRRTIEMLRDFLKPTRDLGSIIFVTTMWDTLHNARSVRRAHSNFAQLQNEILKEFMDDDGIITQFMNTRTSALEIMDGFTWAIHYQLPPTVSAAFQHLYQDLHERIENVLQQKRVLELDLTKPDAQTNLELRSVLEEAYRDNQRVLTKFVGQFAQITEPPPGLEDAHEKLQESIEAIKDAMSTVPPLVFTTTVSGLPATTRDSGQTSSTEPPVEVLAPVTSREEAQSESKRKDTEVIHRSTRLEPLRLIQTTHSGHNTIPAVAPSHSTRLSPQDSRPSVGQLQPSRTLILKGLLRRLVRTVRHGDRKSLK
ncbi:P-loop containing nucleoside triphosphate hydrolase protein [Panaeolus papilionaceus]|nr:P-loop containing nucleoside triphosphate hydrolase protein [Panaeolus papilionaceus]